MNTFLPFTSYKACALALDDKRLGKQRLEARQLLDALLGLSTGWAEHPAASLWRGSEKWLAAYGIAMCKEWIGRGFADSMRDEFVRRFATLPDVPEPKFPEELHSSHRANLVRKDPKRYKDFLGFTEVPSDTYHWPKEGA